MPAGTPPPVTQVRSAPGAPAPSAAGQGTHAPGAPEDRARVLVVDDRRDNLLAMESVLRHPGYELVMCESGAEALRYLLHALQHGEDCALILLDVQMPEMDGFETARLVRGNERLRGVPIVFMTAISREARFVSQGYAAGAIDYLVKPVDPEVLRCKVAAFVELHRARREVVRQAALLRANERLERQRALEQLELRALRRQQAASARYRRLVDELSHAVLWTLEPATRACTFVSASAQALLGQPREAWTRTPHAWQELLPERDRGRMQAALETLAEGRPAALEHALVRADGHEARFRTELQICPAEAEGQSEIRALSVDVTEQRRAQEALAFLASAGPRLFSTLELGPTVEQVARTAVVGLADEAEVEVALPGGPPLSARAVLDPQAPPLAEAAELALPLQHRDRTLGTLRLASARSRGFGPVEVRVAEEFARRAAQGIENALLYREAQEAVRVRDEFISVAAHELRTPLTPLALQTAAIHRALQAQLPDGPARAALLERLAGCGRQVRRMARLVSNLLDVARLRAARLELDLEPCDLGEVVHEVAGKFQEELARSGRRLEVSAEAGLLGRWDRARLDQVLSNLVTNAMRYGGAAPIQVSARVEGAGVVLAVEDRGAGIAPEDQERIFERFAQGGNAGARGGLGLGLYIARQIVEAHGGRIGVRSRLGAGTRFEVELPLDAGAMAQGGAAPASPAVEGAPPA